MLLHLLYCKPSHRASPDPPINPSYFLMCFHGNCRHQYMPSLTSADVHCLQSNYTSPRTTSEGLANLLISSTNSLGSSPVHKSHNTDLPTRGIGAHNIKFWQAHTLQSEVFYRGLGKHTNRHPLIHLYLPTGKLYSGLRFCSKKTFKHYSVLSCASLPLENAIS